MKLEVEKYDLYRLVMLLDASQEALDSAAEREEIRERGKRLKEFTDQQRAKTARKLVAEICETYEIRLD